jgi:hypothetical protein
MEDAAANVRAVYVRNDCSMAQAAATRAPRGTKILTKAFFDAAEQFPETVRADVVKASLAQIRETLKVTREKAAVARAKTKPAKAVRAGSRKKAGRPIGTKNKPKLAARKARAPKPTPVIDIAAE